MYCWKCGKKLPDGVYFCLYCGAKMVVPDPAPQPEVTAPPAADPLEAAPELRPWTEPEPAPAPEPVSAPEPEPEPEMGGLFVPAPFVETVHTPAAGSSYTYKEPVAPETRASTGGAAASETAKTDAPAAKKSKGKDLTYWLLAVICIVLSIVNIRDMNAGEMYHVWFGIPLQYVMIPGAILFIVLGIVELAKPKK